MSNAETHLSSALAAFDFGAPVLSFQRYGQGHINDTFLVVTDAPAGKNHFILQRISNAAFHDPVALMENMSHVTAFLQEKIARTGGDPHREALSVIPAKDGKNYFLDEEDRCWRVLSFIEDSFCLQAVETPEQFYASAQAFAHSQQMLCASPAETLHEIIPKFHHTANRFALFTKALEADALGRAKDCQPEIQFALAHEADCHVCVDALEEGRLPLRVTHNDTKLNNVLFDNATGKAICVIDLDTVMPGLSINDFGDSIRFGANHSAEDEPDLSKVNFDLELFDIYTKGFLEGAGGALTPAELEYLPWGAKLMTLECGIRFLTDYLEGDHYFHTQRPGQNLDRARTQFKLVSDMEACWDQMAAVVRKYAK